MRGDQEMIELLSEALRVELTAVVQFAVHAEMCRNWGYHRLSASIHQQAVDEMEHAERLIQRIQDLGGTPRVDLMAGVRHGVIVEVQARDHLTMGVQTVQQYGLSAAGCGEAGEEGSSMVFERIVADELRHAEYLKSELCEVGEFGLDDYLTKQIH